MTSRKRIDRCVDQQLLGDVKSFNRFQYLEILAAGLDKKENKFHDTNTLKHPNWIKWRLSSIK